VPRRYDILIVYSPDAEEWCQYLQELFLSSRQVRSHKMQRHRLGPDASFSAEDLRLFLGARCVVVLLSGDLVQHFYRPALLPLLQRAFHPPRRVVRLLCGVQGAQDDFVHFFPDWAYWQELTCDDEPETYLAAVRKAISEGQDFFQKDGTFLSTLAIWSSFVSAALGFERGALCLPGRRLQFELLPSPWRFVLGKCRDLATLRPRPRPISCSRWDGMDLLNCKENTFPCVLC
jgi:hypothetical protein